MESGYRTEQAYIHWIKRFIWFHGKRHPAEMGAAEVTSFLTHLARERNVSASTQNQALSSLLFLYRKVLQIDLPWMKGIERAKRPVRVPVVLTYDEVRVLLARLEGTKWMMASLLYGAGLRLRSIASIQVPRGSGADSPFSRNASCRPTRAPAWHGTGILGARSA